MFLNFTRSTFRNLWRHKLHTLINILSLGLGLVVFTVALLYVKNQYAVDHSWPQAERIIRFLGETRNLPGFTNGIGNNIPTSRFRDVREYFSEQLEHITRILPTGVSLVDSQAQRTITLMFVDSDFTDIFELETVQGSLEQVMSGPGFLALEEEFAKTLGEEGVPGARVRYRNGQGTELSYEVAAIFRMPENVSPGVVFDQLTLFDDSNWPLRVNTPNGNIAADPTSQVWATLKPGVTLDAYNAMQADYVQQRVKTYDNFLGKDQRVSDHLIFSWQSLLDIHFNPTIPQEQLNSDAYGSIFRVATVAVVGLLVLFVGCSNSISLSLAAVLERRRETGIRKSVGAQQGDLARQYFGESVVLALLASLPALLVLNQLPALLPRFTGSINLGTALAWSDYLILVAIAIVVGLINGIYPVLVLSSIRPQAVLKPNDFSGVGGKQNVRTLIVATQFCLALMLLTGTAALYAQLAVTRAQPLGFSVDDTAFIVIDRQQIERKEALGTELQKLPAVSSAIHLQNPPNANLPANAISIKFIRKGEQPLEAELAVSNVSFDFFRFMNIPLIAGREFDPRYEVVNIAAEGQGWSFANAQEIRVERVVINRLAARALGFSPEEAVGETIFMNISTRPADGKVGMLESAHLVVGVAEDSMFGSLSRRPIPEVYRFVPPAGVQMVAVKFAGRSDEVMPLVQQTARQVLGAAPLGTLLGEERLANAFAQEQMESRLLLICGVMAMVLSCIGLYGLTAFTMKHRTKEVGVRKVLGSSVASLVLLFLWRFAKPVLLASVVASPVALYFALQWIRKFPYQLDAAWLLPICLATTGTVLLVALLTVTMITTRAASTRPVKSLRYE